MAEVALNLPETSSPFSVFAVSLASALWAGYFRSLGIVIKKVLGYDFAAMRTIEGLFHKFFALSQICSKKKWGCAGEISI